VIKSIQRCNVQGRILNFRGKLLNQAAGNWSKEFLHTTDIGSARIRQVAGTGIKRDLMDSTRWGWECMLQIQEVEDRKTPVARTWAAEMLAQRRRKQGVPRVVDHIQSYS
jgi:hypothetical protein